LGGEHPLTLEEIGDRFDLTRERVRQIKEKAIRRLKHTYRSKILKTYRDKKLERTYLRSFFYLRTVVFGICKYSFFFQSKISNMSVLIAPSLLSADFAHLGDDIEMVNQSQADWFHIDVMDGVFVPNISYGMPVIRAIHKLARKPLDVHLMIVQPERYFEVFRDCGAEYLSVHFEAVTHLHRAVYQIRELGMKAGVVLNPHTPVSQLEEIIADVNLVLLMSVNPGFGGQKFIEATYDKIAKLKKLITEKKSTALIEIDGGVDLKNAGKLVLAGADVLVAGNTVFSSPDPSAAIRDLKFVK